MLWSLIYRKLKANRGNTMITDSESKRLIKLLENENNKKTLNGSNFTFEKTNQKIIKTNKINKYKGKKENINILPRLIKKFNNNRAFEMHLQAYILQNLGFNKNKSLNKCILNTKNKIEWIGNEVSCGAGMQKIDILISQKNKNYNYIYPIELNKVYENHKNI